MKISFIVPVFNNLKESKFLYSAIEKYLISSNDFELIIINDASVDETDLWLASLLNPHLQVITNQSNLGYAKSNNLAASYASGDILLFLNNDLEFDSEWLSPIISILGSYTLNAGVVGNIQHRIADNSIDHIGFELNSQGKFLHIRDLRNPSLVYSKVCAVTGACFAIRKSDFEAVGGFDENFLNGGEDLDLCFKIANLGKSIYVSHESQIKHHVALTRGANSLQNELNSRYLFLKWRSKIKNELSKVWKTILSKNINYFEGLDGDLITEFLSTPCAAARIIAENILAQEEHRWCRELDNIDLNSSIRNSMSIRGARYSSVLKGYLAYNEIELRLLNITSIRNFYVCGLKDSNSNHLQITILINGIQQKIFKLGSERHINVGIVNPILLSGVINVISVTIRNEVEGGLLISAADAVLITHFVIDEKIIDEF